MLLVSLRSIRVVADTHDDMVYVTTSTGQILSIEPPLRDDPESAMIYWRQNF